MRFTRTYYLHVVKALNYTGDEPFPYTSFSSYVSFVLDRLLNAIESSNVTLFRMNELTRKYYAFCKMPPADRFTEIRGGREDRLVAFFAPVPWSVL